MQALLTSLTPRLGERIFSLNSRDVHCLKTCRFDGGTVILFLLMNCPMLEGMEQKTSSDKTGVQPECPKKGDRMEKPRPENCTVLK